MTGVKDRPSLTEGSIFKKMIVYVIPIMLTGILQLLYNTADQIVVGQFSGDPNALAAVGSTSSATGLVVNVIMGMSAGAIVVMSQSFGAKQEQLISRAVHTVVTFAAIAGIFCAAVGLLVTRPLLTAMGTKAELIDSASLYMSIIMCGVPASVMYNFAACVFRAKGDSRTPFIILSLSGLVNVGFNLVFVMGLGMGVEGVAIATIISQYISAAVVLVLLMRTRESYRLDLRRLGIDMTMLKRILVVGIPSGIQSSLFAVSNMLVQSSVNKLTIPEIGGNTVAGTIENYSYTIMNSYYQATLTFVGQNYGAKKLDRVKKTLLYGIIQVSSVGIFIGIFGTIFIKPLARFFVDMTLPSAELIVEAAAVRSRILLPTYFFCGCMETLTAYQRGLGSSLRPMIISLFSICALRVSWASFVFPIFGTARSLYLVYPLSWIVCASLHLIFCISMTKKIQKMFKIKGE